jgi:dihydroorotase
MCRVTPPFRGQRDREAIRAALIDGTIDAICSDHTPLDDDAKSLPFGEADPGTTGLEVLLPLILKWASEEGIGLPVALAKASSGAAAILGIDRGQMKVGAKADICVFDPHRAWTVERQTLASQGKHTPYLGRELLGRVQYTLVGGKTVYEAPQG